MNKNKKSIIYSYIIALAQLLLLINLVHINLTSFNFYINSFNNNKSNNIFIYIHIFIIHFLKLLYSY